MADDTQITELTELEATKVSGVGSPANGTGFLLLKATDVKDCPTCEGTGKIREGNVQCPGCKGSGNVAKDEGAGSVQDELEDVVGESLKALSDKDRESMPASKFAFVDKNGGKHLPIHDEGHVKAAVARFGQTDFSEADDPKAAKAKAAAKIVSAAKEHGIEVSDDSQVGQAAKSTGVPAESVQTPEARPAPDDLNVHSADGQSGVAGPLTAGDAVPPEAWAIPGGQTTANIPLDTQTREHQIPITTDGAGILRSHPTERVGKAAASLVQAIAEIEAQRENAAKDGVVPSPTLDEQQTPGDPAWEGYDAKTLSTAATSLAQLCAILDAAAEREQIEGETADSGDWAHAYQLEDAGQALDYALGVVARLSVLEAQEASKTSGEQVAKVGRRLSGKTVQALQAARDHLVNVLGEDGEGNAADADTDDGAKKAGSSTGSTTSEEVFTVADVTKEELVELVKTSSAEAARAAVEAIMKNANNGGDISAADIKPTSETDDVRDVAETVDPEFVNKSETDADTAQVEKSEEPNQLEELTKQVAGLTDLVGKIARRPRPGGPTLDGQVRVAAEGRQDGGVVKSEQDLEIEKLEKQLDDTKDPTARSHIGEALTLARFRQAHEQGLI